MDPAPVVCPWLAGNAKADDQAKSGGSSLQAPASAAELEASRVTPALRLKDEETKRSSLTAPTAPFESQMPVLATVSTEQPVQASLDALVRASETASTAKAAGDLAPSVASEQMGRQAGGRTVAQASAAPKAENAEGQMKSGSEAVRTSHQLCMTSSMVCILSHSSSGTSNVAQACGWRKGAMYVALAQAVLFSAGTATHAEW